MCQRPSAWASRSSAPWATRSSVVPGTISSMAARPWASSPWLCRPCGTPGRPCGPGGIESRSTRVTRSKRSARLCAASTPAMLAPTTTAWRWVVLSIVLTGPGPGSRPPYRRRGRAGRRGRWAPRRRAGRPRPCRLCGLGHRTRSTSFSRTVATGVPSTRNRARYWKPRCSAAGTVTTVQLTSGHSVDGDVRDLAAVVPREQRCAGRGLDQRGEDHGVAVLVADERVVAVPGRPDGDVVAEVTDEDVVARRGSAVRAADEDVAAGAAEERVAPPVADEQVLVVAAEQHVGVVHVLRGGHAGRLDERVVGVVVVEADRDVTGRGAGLDQGRGGGGEADHEGARGQAGRADPGEVRRRERAGWDGVVVRCWVIARFPPGVGGDATTLGAPWRPHIGKAPQIRPPAPQRRRGNPDDAGRCGRHHGGMVDRVSAPLIGRDGPLEVLVGNLGRARSGNASVVLVSGETGVGKTRLVTEFLDRERPAVLAGACVPLAGEPLPYAALTQALRQGSGVVREATTRSPELARLLPGTEAPTPGGGPTPGSGDRLRLFQAVLALLARMGAERPVVHVVEDLHWADRSTLDLLAFLATNLRDERVLLLLTYRTDSVDRQDPLSRWLAELGRLHHTERVVLDRLEHAAGDRAGHRPDRPGTRPGAARGHPGPLGRQPAVRRAAGAGRGAGRAAPRHPPRPPREPGGDAPGGDASAAGRGRRDRSGGAGAAAGPGPRGRRRVRRGRPQAGPERARHRAAQRRPDRVPAPGLPRGRVRRAPAG